MKKPKSRAKRIVRRIILTLLLLAILAGAVFYGYSRLKQEYTVTYTSYTATTGSISNALSFSGNLSLVDSKTYTASASTTVRTIYVDEGDTVAEGDKLIRMSNGNTIEADFDGKVNTISVEEGDEVSAGTTLIQIADFEHMKVTLRVDEYDIGDVSVGQSCSVTVTSTEKAFTSEIASIDYISASNGSVAYYSATAYVTVDEGTYPGMQVTVSIPQSEATDVVILKADAISFDTTNQAYVWMKDENDELQQVYIETGVSNGNYVEIKSGLSDGDVVYVEVEVDTSSGGMFASMFGGQEFTGGGGGGFDSSNMPDMSSFDSGNMPDMSSFDSGNMPNFSGGMPGGGQ